MAVYGADLERLSELARRFDAQWAGELERLISDIDSQVQASVDIWVGPDADSFRNQRWPEHRTALNHAREALVQAGTTARNNVREQEATSGRLA